ncbi:MAG: hypothetical protein MI741_10795, partial [Rhodospirillales bacterium]|nr:hypothetical protein [Rhodospirillales bacterium]
FAYNLYGDKAWPSMLDIVPQPSEMPAFMDAIWIDGWPTEVDAPPADFSSINETTVPHMWRFLTNRHGLVTNVGYLDGHGEQIDLREMWMQRWNPAFEPNPIR